MRPARTLRSRPLPERPRTRGRTPADVLGPAHERRPAGPVDGVAVARARPRSSASANATDRADRHGEARHRAARDANATATRSRSSTGRRSAGRRSSDRRRSELVDAVRCTTRSASSRYLSTVPSVARTGGLVERARAERGQRLRPSRWSRRRPAACRGRARAAPRPRPRPGGPAAPATPGSAQPDDLPPRARRSGARPSGRGSAASSASCTSRVRFDVMIDDRRHRGAERAELGHGDRVVGQDLEQERLELVVGPVDLVDQQDRRRAVGRRRSPAAAAGGRGTARSRARSRAPRRRRAGAAGRLGGAQVQQLAAVVPLVDAPGDVDALVALQADQLAAASTRRAPWPPRSCRRRPRPRAAAAGAAAARGRSPWPGPRRRR